MHTKQENPLQNLTSRISKFLEGKEEAAGMYPRYRRKGAFDTTSFDCFCTAALRKEVNTKMCKLIMAELPSRIVKTDIAEESIGFTTTIGCQQNGMNALKSYFLHFCDI